MKMERSRAAILLFWILSATCVQHGLSWNNFGVRGKSGYSQNKGRGNVSGKEPYYGRFIGEFVEFAHGIKGTVYAVDEYTIFIKGFVYDGTGPDAFFWIGNSPRPSPDGYIIPYPEDYTTREPPVLNAHNGTDIILKLPPGKRLRDIRWLSVWCRRFTVDFGEVFIPPNLETPRARVLPEFRRLAHGLRSGNISVLDARTFYIPNLHYDGAGPDAYFWVGTGPEPTPYGHKVPNEMGSLEPLRGYQGEDIEIQLPGNMTAYDIDWLAVWCVQYRHNFGHVNIPKDLDVPPALGQTKITTSSTERPVKTNCREFLDKRIQVRWEVQGDEVEIELSARIVYPNYMSFGISGAQGRAEMTGADVVVAWWNETTSQPHVVDYSMLHKAQCDGKSGVCPDADLGGHDDITIVSGSLIDGVVTAVYRRPLAAKDPQHDRPILLGQSTTVVAALGPLDSWRRALKHSASPYDKTTKTVDIMFDTQNDNTCEGIVQDSKYMVQPWPARKIVGEKVFRATIGPAAGQKGYVGITGKPSWGIAWYMNDLLIPELYVERGQTYTFIVEGGDDDTNPAKNHPLYITDSSEGGFGQMYQHERVNSRTFAGVRYDVEAYPYPDAMGRYCEWTHKTIDQSLQSETFEDFMKTLELKCDTGFPAMLNWTVEDDTPDLVYYQCYTHRYLGWKIHVLEPGEIEKMLSVSHGTQPHQSHLLQLISIISTIISIFLANR